MKRIFLFAASCLLLSSCLTTSTPAPDAVAADTAAPAVPELPVVDRAKLAEKYLDNLLLSVKNNDFKAYFQDFAPDHKDKITEAQFKERNSKLTEQCGDYVSREFLGCLHKQVFDVYLWKAKFSKLPEDEIILRLFVINDAGAYKVYAFNVKPF